MDRTYKVKLLTCPKSDSNTVRLSDPIAPAGISRPLASPARFSTMLELRKACERASIPALVYGMPSPNIVYQLTFAQLATLGFDLQDQDTGTALPAPTPSPAEPRRETVLPRRTPAPVG